MQIIRDPRCIQENFKVNDNLIEFETNKLKDEIERIDESSVVAIVGGYGVGKSTALYNIQQADNNKSHRWFQFDAWRYPERKGLWDGLVIELAKQIGVEHKTVRKIDGNKSVLGKWGGVVAELFGQFGESLPTMEIDKINIPPDAATGMAKIGDKALTIFGRNPAKRAYEIERILADIILSVGEQTIYIVAEDVDRSGSDGINFLETINYFIKNNEQLAVSKKKIVVIAPISDKAYIELRESLYKCVDLFVEYTPLIKSSHDFVMSVFTDQALGKFLDNKLPHLENIENFINSLLEIEDYAINIRKLKLIIRHTNQKYLRLVESEKGVDWRPVFVIEAMRIGEDSKHKRSLLDSAMLTGEIPAGTIFSALLRTVYKPEERIFTYKYANDRSREHRQINPRATSHRFDDYNGQHSASTWESWEEFNGNTVIGHIARYYLL